MKKQLLSSVTALLSASALMAQLPVSQTASNKNVVLEEFTGIYCGFCPDGHRIANNIKAANPDDVVLINVHVGGYANPNGSDPDFRTPFGSAIVNQTDLQGYPAGTVNRHLFAGNSQQGGSGTAQGRNTWTSTSSTILSESSYANVALQASLDIQTREITVDVEVYYTGNGAAANRLNVALLQNGIEGPQSGMSANNAQILPNGNYEHNHMLRHLITGQWGDTISTTSQGTLIQRQYVYSIPADLNGVAYELGELEVVAFLAEGQQEIITGAEGPISYVIPPGTTLVDLASSTNMQSPNSYCDGAVVPEITVNNADTASITSYEVSYSLNGGTAVTQTVSNPLAGGASATTSFPGITLSPGENVFTYTVNALNGSSYVEVVMGNNSATSEAIYIVPSAAFAQTHQEGFESSSVGASAPNNAIADNPDDISALVVSNAVSNSVSQEIGGFGKSSKSFLWNFFSIPTGKSSMLVFEKLDFSVGTGHGVKFNHAYAQYQAENDKLEVLVSTDCGITWSNVYSKQGSALTTASASTSSFFPAVTEWKNNFVDLASYAGESEVIIAFKGTSAYGNNLFVDDIQILDGTTIGVEENEALSSATVYPNPSNGNSVLALSLSEQAGVNVAIYNSLGELVVANTTHNLSAGVANLNLDLSNLNNGVYFAHVTIDGSTVVKQITLFK
ncbi:MAG: Omp28-related outer membrane protein [Flavobacteriales bacterium]|jgi:thiol-disulfide isomerase/thioredoxin|nr:Omp28-related outer membrane protein [Flavobacteriales bacterium]